MPNKMTTINEMFKEVYGDAIAGFFKDPYEEVRKTKLGRKLAPPVVSMSSRFSFLQKDGVVVNAIGGK